MNHQQNNLAKESQFKVQPSECQGPPAGLKKHLKKKNHHKNTTCHSQKLYELFKLADFQVSDGC